MSREDRLSASEPRETRGRRRRIGLIAALVVAVIAAGAVALRVRALSGTAADELAAALGKAAHADARVGRSQVSLLALSVRAFDIEVACKGERVLRARELRIRPSLSALLAGRVDLRSIEVLGAELHLTPDNLEHLGAALGSDFAFQSIAMPEARVRVDGGDRGRLEADGAALEFSARGDRLRVELAAQRGALVLAGKRKALSKIGFAGAIDPREVAVDRLELAAQGLTLTAREGRFARPLGGAGAAQLAIDAQLAELAPLVAPAAAPAISGRIQGKGKVALAKGAPVFDAKLVLEGGRFGEVALPARIELGVASSADGTLVHGKLPIGQPALQAAFSATPRLAAGGVVFESLELRRGGSTLRGRAEIGDRGALALALEGDAVDLADVAPLFGGELAALGLQGRGQVKLSAQGALAAPALRAELALEAAKVGAIDLGQSAFSFVVEPGGRKVTFERAELQGPERKLSAEQLQLTLDGGVSEATARLRIARLPLDELYRFLGAAGDPWLAKLSASARGKVELTFARGGRGEQVELALDLSEVGLDGYRFDSGRLDAQVRTTTHARGGEARSFALRKLDLRAGSGSLELSGDLPSQGSLALQVAMDELPIERFAFAQRRARGLSGRASGSGRIAGSSSEPRAEVTLRIDELRAGDQRLGPVEMIAALRGRADAKQPPPASLSFCRAGAQALAAGSVGASGWNLCGKGPGDRARFDLAVGTGGGHPVRGTLAWAGVDLAPLLPESSAGQRWAGALTATLTLQEGGLDQLEQVSGTLQVRKLSVGQGEVALASSAPFEVAIKRGALALQGAELVSGSTRLALGAKGQLGKDARITATGKIDAQPLLAPIPGLRNVFGQADVQLALALGLPATLQAEADLRDVTVEIAKSVYVRKLNGKMVVQGRDARLEDLRAEFGGGVLRASGKLELAGMTPQRYHLQLAAENVAFEPQPRFEIALNAEGRLDYEGQGKPPRLSGKIRLLRGLYGRHIQLPEALVALNKSERETLAAYSPARDRLALDLTIEHAQPLQIRNNFLDAEVAAGGDGKLRVVGTDQRLGLSGKLEILRGRVLYRGDEFKVSRGEIAFTDKQRVAPRFEVRAAAESKKRKDANIVFAAHGDRDAFEIRISCDAADAPKPFTCDFAQNKLRCDTFDDLVTLWVCGPSSQLSAR